MSQMTKLHRNLGIHCDTGKMHGPGHSREANQRVIAAISAICGKALYQSAREARPLRVAASRSANAFAREAAEAELFGACSRVGRQGYLVCRASQPNRNYTAEKKCTRWQATGRRVTIQGGGGHCGQQRLLEI